MRISVGAFGRVLPPSSEAGTEGGSKSILMVAQTMTPDHPSSAQCIYLVGAQGRAMGSLNLVVRPSRLPAAVAGALVLVSIIPACASASTVGVRPGDWWEYGTSASFSSNHPEGPDPREMMEMVPIFYRVAVVGVSDTAVFLEVTAGFRNGTTVKGEATGDLSTGTGNLTILDLRTATFLFPAGLSKGDWPWGTMVPQDPGHTSPGYPPVPPMHINDTLSRSYAGATREVNVMSGTQPEAWGPGWYRAETTMIIFFDKVTGIVCEISLNVTSTQGDWVTTMSNTMELAATNAWTGTGIGEIGVIPGAVGLLSVIVLGQRHAKRRREGLTRSGGHSMALLPAAPDGCITGRRAPESRSEQLQELVPS